MEFKTSDKEYTLHTLIDKSSKQATKITVGEYFDTYIDMLQRAGRIGNADTFIHLRTALTKCFGSLDFYFSDIDVAWLKRLESWFRLAAHHSENSLPVLWRR